MPDIQVVTFDLWQTLLLEKEEWGRERARLRIESAVETLREAGERFTKEEVLKAYEACNRACESIRQEGGDVSFKEQVQIFVRGIGDGLLERIGHQTFALILNRYAQPFLELPPVMADGAAEVLSSLREQGYRLGLISNTGATPGRFLRAYLEEMDILKYFDHLTFSDEVLMSKPSRFIFLHSLASMACQASQAVHVGDHLRNDIQGAQQVGIRTVWVEGFDHSSTDTKPDVVIRRMADLPEALDKLKAS